MISKTQHSLNQQKARFLIKYFNLMSSIYISSREFITKKAVVHTGMVYCILHDEIKIKGFYKISKYKIF